MLETGIFGALRRIQRPVGYMLGGLGVGGLLACSPLTEGSGGEAPGQRTPDQRIVIDCQKDPAAKATEDVLVAGIQILRLVVAGPGYSQESRVQLMGIRSDINVSGPDGQGPKQSIWQKDIATGNPVVVSLQNGGFLTVQKRAENSTASASAASIPASPSAAAAHWLTFTLSCQLPPETAADSPRR